MPVTDELRQRQIREVLDYDIIQNKRVFDNQVKNVDAFTETNAQPKKADIELEADIKNRVSEIVIKINSLTSNIDEKAKTLVTKEPEVRRTFNFDYSERSPDELPSESTFIYPEEESIGTDGTSAYVAEAASAARRELEQESLDEGRLALEKRKFVSDLSNTIDKNLSTIYSLFNSLVDKINSRFRNSQGFSSQGKSNIMALLQPLTDSAKESLSSIIVLKEAGDEGLYNRAYNLIYEIIQSIDNAYPLMRLDITKIADSHYATVPEVKVNTDEFRKQMSNYYEEASAIQNDITHKLGQLGALRNEISVLENTENFDPNDQDYQDLVNEFNALVADFAEYENEGGENIQRIIAEAVAKERRSTNEVSVIADEILQRVNKLEEQIQTLEDKRNKLTSGFRKVPQATLDGIDIKIRKLRKQQSELVSSVPQIQSAYQDFSDANPFKKRDPGSLGLKLPTATETMLVSPEQQGRLPLTGQPTSIAGTPGGPPRVTGRIGEEVSPLGVTENVERPRRPGRPRRSGISTTDVPEIEEEGRVAARLEDFVANEQRIMNEQQAMIDAEERGIEQARQVAAERARLEELLARLPRISPLTVPQETVRGFVGETPPLGVVRPVAKPGRPRKQGEGKASSKPATRELTKGDVDRIANDPRLPAKTIEEHIVKTVNGKAGLTADEDMTNKIFNVYKGEKGDLINSYVSSEIARRKDAKEAKRIADMNAERARREATPKAVWNAMGKPVKGGARKDLTPDEVNAIMIKRNKAFAKNNLDTQPPEGPVSYLGLKPDNSMGAGKKFDAESARVLDNLIQKEKVKAGAKKSKKSKQLPTLIFDDKKNDWYI